MEKKVNNLTFLEHLDEFRGRLIKSFIAFIVFTAIFSFFVDEMMVIIVKPVGKLVFTSPSDAFFAQVVLTFLGGFLLALPIVIYQIWNFVVAGLKEREGRFVAAYAPISILLFFLGGAFAYFIAIPLALKFLLSFRTEYIEPMITIKSYISFVGSLLLAFGVVFELPLVLFFLTKIGIATPAFLTQKRKHAFVIILIISAIITPPDVITQLIMAGPLMILYEIGVIVSKVVYRKKLLEEGVVLPDKGEEVK